MEEFEEAVDYDGNIPEEFRAVQQSINCFVDISYETSFGIIMRMKLTQEDLALHRGKGLDIIRNNPPLESIPKYFHDGREDYLWYSDFYYDIGKLIWRQYSHFAAPTTTINKTNYTEELAKIDLPYFKELVDLVALERLCIAIEKRLPVPSKEVNEEKVPASLPLAPKSPKPKRINKRSYEPSLNKKHYSLLVEYLEKLKLFRRPIKVPLLRKLFAGKLPEPLQVANQKSLVYLFDQLMEHSYIKGTWMAVADGNKDFISFRTDGNQRRYGNGPHYIDMQQLTNCRNRNKREQIFGLENIDTLIDELNKSNLE